MYKQYHLAMVEAVEPFKMHLTSMSYKYEVFEHLHLLWMGIWLHTHTVSTTTNVSPDLGELAEILGDASVQTIPLCYGWGCYPFKLHPHPCHTYMKCLNIFNCFIDIWHPWNLPAICLVGVQLQLLPWVCRTKPIHCKRFGNLKQCRSQVLDTLDTWQLTDNIMSMK